MALARVFLSLREGVINRIAIPASATAVYGAVSNSQRGWARSFAEGHYLKKDDVTQRVLNVVKNFDKVEPSKVTPTASFQKDLGLDSLDTVEVVMAFEEEFAIEIPDSEADKITSCSEAIEYVSSHPQAK